VPGTGLYSFGRAEHGGLREQFIFVDRVALSAFFAVKVHGTGGWSELSNNTFWPQWKIYLPQVLN
jgi:hypothetical protein